MKWPLYGHVGRMLCLPKYESDQWKRPERACAPVFAAQIRAGRRAFAKQQPVAVHLHQVELLPARRDRHDP
jgi:hypothetical protein